MKCVLCSSKKHEEVFSGKNWKALKCSKCSLVSIVRDKNGINYDFYYRDDDYKKLESHFKNIFQKRVNIVKRFHKNPGVILEIGCSNGVMLDIFKKDGWETWGVEPSENAEYAIDKGHKILQTTFEKVNITPDYFDVVLLNHTLEHLVDPQKVLMKIHTLLKKQGIVFVDVPNFGSLSSQILRKHWPYLLPKEHNFQFTKDSLSKMLDKAGFEVIHFESRSGIFEFGTPLEEVKDSLTGLKKRFLIRIVSFAYDLVATIFNKGDSMSMVGKKV